MERNPALRNAAAAVLSGLTVVALTVFVRRTLGGPFLDLPATEAAAYTAAFSFLAAWAARLIASRPRPEVSAAAAVAAFVLSLFFAAGLTTASVAGLACLLSSAIVIGTVTAACVLSTAEAPAGCDPAHATRSVAPLQSQVERGAGEATEGDDADRPALRLVRTAEGGRERIDGLLRFEIPAGDVATVLHVPLWPPLASDPAVRCELEGLDGRVRVPLAKPHGFRIEVRIPDPLDEPLEGVVKFTAECRAASAAA